MGLQRVTFSVSFSPTIEAGWCLARAQWGKGYASEATRAALAHGVAALALTEIVACTVPDNLGSRPGPNGHVDYPVMPEEGNARNVA